MSPGRADQHGHRLDQQGTLAELFRDLSRLVDTRVAGITDAEVDERLERFLWSAGYARSGEGAVRDVAAASGRHLAAASHQSLPARACAGLAAARSHIGLDRLLGMGLKYNDRFTHTHLGDRPDAR